jgi:NlpC/P60 family putative phage cell wall peptidase
MSIDRGNRGPWLNGPPVGAEAPADREKLIVAIARSWLGTPYRHQASLKGVGCDCLGLVRGVYAEACGRPTEPPPPYSRDWAEAPRRETLIEAAERHLLRVPIDEISAGDVLVFRLRPGAMAKHCAILTEGSLAHPTIPASHTLQKFIHAMEGVAVCEISLTPWWRRRIAAAFRFPST